MICVLWYRSHYGPTGTVILVLLFLLNLVGRNAVLTNPLGVRFVGIPVSLLSPVMAGCAIAILMQHRFDRPPSRDIRGWRAGWVITCSIALVVTASPLILPSNIWPVLGKWQLVTAMAIMLGMWSVEIAWTGLGVLLAAHLLAPASDIPSWAFLLETNQSHLGLGLGSLLLAGVAYTHWGPSADRI